MSHLLPSQATATMQYANNEATITIPIIVTDTGQGFNTSSFISSDIEVLVDNNIVSPESKTLTFNNVNGNNYNYVLTLYGVPSDGVLSLMIKDKSIQDNFGNKNVLTELIVSNLLIDNTKPTISFSQTLETQYISSNSNFSVDITITDYTARHYT